MPLIALRLQAPRAVAGILADHLDENFQPQPLSVSRYEILGDETWEIEAHFDPAPDSARIAAALTEALKGQEPPGFTITKIEDRDWVRQSLAGLKPVRADRFFVHGAHDRGIIPAAAIAVQIDAGQAFGTGHHQTTMGCLEALCQIARMSRPRRILDVGTGSGLLGIAAAKLLKTRVVATDNDPVAVHVARDNARVNGVAPLFFAVVAQGVRHNSVARHRHYDLIFANILARPLINLAGELSACLAPGGTVVLSGILNPQSQSVLTAYRARGLVLRQRMQRGDWTTLIIAGSNRAALSGQAISG